MSDHDRTMIEDAIARFDLRDPAFLADPYPVLAALREAAPVCWYEPTRQWLVTRHTDVAATLRDRRLGRVYTHRASHAEFGRPEPDPRFADFAFHERWSLLQLEPPDHTRIRALIARAFTPRSIADLEPLMRRYADALLDALVAEGGFDLLRDYAQPYSIRVICELLGVPADDAQQLLDWSHAIVRMYELAAPDADRVRADTAARDFTEYAYRLLAARRGAPDGRLLARLATVEEGGQRLTDHEIVCTLIVLLNAGHEATVNTLGNGVRALLTHPDQWARLVSGEVAAADAVEELIRYDAPLQLFERWVLDAGVVIAGQELQRGDEVAMLFGAANRDPRRFADPDRFDIGRADASHVGFGGGIHFCVGAPLARLETAIALQTLVERAPELRLAGEAPWTDGFVIHGLRALPVATR